MSDKLRALTEHPELRELMEAYVAAPPGDPERVLEAFIEKARSTHPDWRRTIDRSERNGVVLRAMFDDCLKTVLARSELSELQRAKAMHDAADFRAAIEALQKVDPPAGEIAFKMATTVLFMALDAGLDRDEVEKLRRRMPAELGRKGGKAPKKERPWRAHATELAQDAYLKDANASNGKIAAAISDWWKIEPDCPSHRTLERLVSTLRKRGTLQARSI